MTIKVVTIHNLNQCTAQEVFDFIADNLLKQGRVSTNSGGCAYRGNDDCKCAAGFLIPDDDYKPDHMEGVSWGGLIGRGFVPPDHGELIRNLQRVHDRDDPCEWADVLQRVAKDRGLKFRF